MGVAAHLRSLVAAGGKRLRPAFVYWGFRAGGRADDELVVPVAAAVEMLHTFALLHDDVMDRARRPPRPAGGPAVFADVHRREGLGGDAELVRRQRRDPRRRPRLRVGRSTPRRRAAAAACAVRGVRERFTALRTEVMTGQYLDLRLDRSAVGHRGRGARASPCSSRGATPSTRPLELGLALAGADGAGRRAAEYGDPLGLAFQMRDDVLGLFGDGDRTGKDVPTTSAPASAPCSCCGPSPSARRSSAPCSSTDLGDPGR